MPNIDIKELEKIQEALFTLLIEKYEPKPYSLSSEIPQELRRITDHAGLCFYEAGKKIKDNQLEKHYKYLIDISKRIIKNIDEINSKPVGACPYKAQEWYKNDALPLINVIRAAAEEIGSQAEKDLSKFLAGEKILDHDSSGYDREDSSSTLPESPSFTGSKPTPGV